MRPAATAKEVGALQKAFTACQHLEQFARALAALRVESNWDVNGFYDGLLHYFLSAEFAARWPEDHKEVTGMIEAMERDAQVSALYPKRKRSRT